MLLRERPSAWRQLIDPVQKGVLRLKVVEGGGYHTKHISEIVLPITGEAKANPKPQVCCHKIQGTKM